MGCAAAHSVLDGQDVALRSGPAAKHFFYLDDLPWSIYASADGPKGMNLRVLGADSTNGEAMRSLEAAFNKRGFLAMSAQIVTIGGLIDHSFKLALFPQSASSKCRKPDGLASTDPEISCEEVALASLQTAFPAVKASVGEDRPLVHLSVKHRHAVGLRAAVIDAVRKSRHRVVYAKFNTAPGDVDPVGEAWASDELWLQSTGLQDDVASDKVATQRIEALVQAAVKRSASLCESLPAVSVEQTPPKCYHSKTTASLINALREADAPRRLSHASGALRGIPDVKETPCRAGFQVSGYTKYTGARLALAAGLPAHKPDQEKGAPMPILEIRTFFVKEEESDVASKKNTIWQRAVSPLSALSSGVKEYSEFVSWLDVPTNTWTIFKVFLNRVLSSGNNYGAQAIAEHLSGTPEMFFNEGEASLNSGSGPVGSIPMLEKIVICDVVNWNTYMLMMVAASEKREATSFGEHFGDVISDELRSSKMTYEDLMKWTTTAIFKQTALGRLVCNVLDIWNKQLDLQLEVQDVAVEYESSYEHINGELRRVMDVKVSIGQAELCDFKLERQISPFVTTIGPVIGAAGKTHGGRVGRGRN